MATRLGIVTDADVYRRFGGQQYVNQVLDPSGTGTYDQNIMDLAVADAEQEVVAFCNVQSDITAWHAAVAAGTATWEQVHLLPDLVARSAVAKCWVYGGQGQAKPQHVKDDEAAVQALCERIARREVSIGAPPSGQATLATNQLFERVDNDPQRNRMTRPAFRARGGFC